MRTDEETQAAEAAERSARLRAEKSLLRADLNLLKVLYVLLEERNVSRAAERLFVTQSAVSRSLTRLRTMFDDPLLIRSSHGLVPTERARQLAVEVRAAVEQISGILEAPSFNPAAARGVVRIAAPESFVLTAMPRLALDVKQLAPGLCIESLHLPDDYLALLEAGSLDFAINHEQPYPDAYQVSPLTSAVPVFWFRREHPLRRKREISLSDIVSYPIISFHSQNVSRMGDRLLRETIRKAGFPPPNIIIDTSHLFVALDVLLMSDSIMLGMESLSQVPAFSSNLISRPMQNVSTFGRGRTMLSLIQHERTARSALHRWMGEKIHEHFRRAEAG